MNLATFMAIAIEQVMRDRNWMEEQAMPFVAQRLDEARDACRQAGAPYGDDDDGLLRWIAAQDPLARSWRPKKLDKKPKAATHEPE